MMELTGIIEEGGLYTGEDEPKRVPLREKRFLRRVYAT
jgi:hypothetical protein